MLPFKSKLSQLTVSVLPLYTTALPRKSSIYDESKNCVNIPLIFNFPQNPSPRFIFWLLLIFIYHIIITFLLLLLFLSAVIVYITDNLLYYIFLVDREIAATHTHTQTRKMNGKLSKIMIHLQLDWGKKKNMSKSMKRIINPFLL